MAKSTLMEDLLPIIVVGLGGYFIREEVRESRRETLAAKVRIAEIEGEAVKESQLTSVGFSPKFGTGWK